MHQIVCQKLRLILLRASQMNDFYMFITHLDVVTSENIFFSLNTLWGEAMGARINFRRGGASKKKAPILK